MAFPAVSSSFSFGPVSIHWYGLLVVVGIMAGYVICRYLLRVTRYPFPVTSKNFDSLFFWLVIWGFIGARLYHVFNEPAYYWNYPIEILKFWNGGLAIHGSILAGVIVVLYFSIRHPELDSGSRNQNKQKQTVIASRPRHPMSGGGVAISGDAINEIDSSQTPRNDNFFSFSFFSGFQLNGWNDVKRFFFISDILVIGLAVGQAIGRWGNYFNQELFGKPTNGFFKVFIDAAHRPVGFENVEYYHPTFLYESVLNLGLFIILFVVYKRSHSVIMNLIQDPETNTKTKRSFGFLFFLSGFRVKARNDGGERGFENNKNVPRSTFHVPGLTTSLYLLGYGLTRFFIDFVRIDPRPFFGGLYLSQWVSILMIVIGVGIWYTIHSKQRTGNREQH